MIQKYILDAFSRLILRLSVGAVIFTKGAASDAFGGRNHALVDDYARGLLTADATVRRSCLKRQDIKKGKRRGEVIMNENFFSCFLVSVLYLFIFNGVTSPSPRIVFLILFRSRCLTATARTTGSFPGPGRWCATAAAERSTLL